MSRRNVEVEWADKNVDHLLVSDEPEVDQGAKREPYNSLTHTRPSHNLSAIHTLITSHA